MQPVHVPCTFVPWSEQACREGVESWLAETDPVAPAVAECSKAAMEIDDCEDVEDDGAESDGSGDGGWGFAMPWEEGCGRFDDRSVQEV